jgi:hypothetical protein
MMNECTKILLGAQIHQGWIENQCFGDLLCPSSAMILMLMSTLMIWTLWTFFQFNFNIPQHLKEFWCICKCTVFFINIFSWLYGGLKKKKGRFTGIPQENWNTSKNLLIVNKLNEIQNQNSNSVSLSSYDQMKFLIPRGVLSIESQNGKPSG